MDYPLLGGSVPTFEKAAVWGILKARVIRSKAALAVAVLLVLSSGTCFAPLLRAQATSGTILGTVEDPAGGAIDDATVTITNVATSQSKIAHTDSEGNYSVLYLIPGRYEVTVEKPGFDVVKRTAFPLDVDQKARVNVKMQIGNVNQTVTITSAVPLLKTDSSEVGQVVESKQITELPLNQRNFTNLLALTSGVAPEPDSGTDVNNPANGTNIVVNGLPYDGNNWILDGISNNEGFFNYATVLPSIDAIQEFKSITSNYSAEYGKAGGANVQISIKSGTNAFHGVVFEFLRNNAFDANDYFSNQHNSPIPPYRQNQFGGNLGGPIRRNRTFFFVDYEGFRSSLGQTATLTVPTALQREGVFTETDPSTGASQPTIYNPLTHQPYPNNTVTNINPVATNILKLIPMPNVNGPNGVAPLVNNYFAHTQITRTSNQGDVRVDHRVSDKNQAFARYSDYVVDVAVPPYLGVVAGGPPDYFAAFSHNINQNGVVSDVHTFSPTLLNEFRFGINSSVVRWNSFDGNTNTSEQVGIPGINGACQNCGGLARIVVSGIADWGHAQFAPTLKQTTVFNWIDDVTMLKGRHTIKVGADIARMRASLFQTQNPVGEFDFDQNMTSNAGSGGIGLASFLVGYESKASRAFMSGMPNNETNQLFFFAQDDVRLRANLTVNLGLRYEIYTAPTSNRNQQSNFDLASGDILLACIAISCTGGVNTEYGHVEPRVGFAYSVDPKTVIRSAFGTSAFPPGSGGQIGTLADNPPFQLSQQLNPSTIFTPGPSIDQGLPPVPPLPARPGAPAGHYIPFGSTTYYLDHNLHQTEAYQWMLDFQRTLAPNLLLDIAYVGNAAAHIYNNTALLGNVPQLDPGTTVPLQQRRPYYAVDPDLQAVTLRYNPGHSSYNSLQVRLDKQFSHGLYFLAAYTWSKTLQRGQDFVDPNNFMIKDVNAQSIPNRFVVSYSYQLPIGRGKAYGGSMNDWQNAVVGGWQIQGITNFRGGYPFSTSIGSELDNGLANIPNQIHSAKVSNQSIKQWFDYTAFTQPGDAYGTAPYNSLRGPHGVNWDMSLFKNFQFSEARYLQFRAEFFNIFNNVQFGTPNAFICGGLCGEGTITGYALGYNPRLIQFALKLYF